MHEDPVIGNLYALYQTIADSFHESYIKKFTHFSVIKTQESIWPNIAYELDEEYPGDVLIKEIITAMDGMSMKPFVIAKDSKPSVDYFKINRLWPIERWTAMQMNIPFAKKEIKIDSGIAIQNLTGEDAVSWTRIVSNSLFGGKQVNHEIFISLQETGVELVTLTFNLEIVGTTMIFLDKEGIAGLYMVCIDEKYRGKGFGRLLVEYCINQLVDLKVKKCVLHATMAGIPLYSAIGFSTGTNYNLYWKI